MTSFLSTVKHQRLTTGHWQLFFKELPVPHTGCGHRGDTTAVSSFPLIPRRAEYPQGRRSRLRVISPRQARHSSETLNGSGDATHEETGGVPYWLVLSFAAKSEFRMEEYDADLAPRPTPNGNSALFVFSRISNDETANFPAV